MTDKEFTMKPTANDHKYVKFPLRKSNFKNLNPSWSNLNWKSGLNFSIKFDQQEILVHNKAVFDFDYLIEFGSAAKRGI